MTQKFRFNPRAQLSDAKGYPTALTSQFLDNLDGLTADVGVIVGTIEVQTLTNKTIDGDDNTLTDIGTASLKTRTGVDVAVVTGTAGAASSLSMWNGDGDLVDTGILAALVLQSTAIGVTVQAYDATLQSISALGTAADRLAYTTGVDTWAESPITAAGRAILDDADAAAQRVTLGLEIGIDVQGYDAQLATLAGLTGADGAFIRWTGAETAVMQPIVGTVSQSGGRPTGAIVENGSNANGEYVRFADGTQICWNDNIALSFSNTSNLSATWTFPAVFAVAPDVKAQLNFDNFSLIFRSAGTRDYHRNVTTTNCAVGVASNAAFVAGNESLEVMTATAFGRWFT